MDFRKILKIFSLLAVLFSSFVFAQKQNYFVFGYHQKYGIADAESQEIVAPIYAWNSYTIHYQSDYCLLMGKGAPSLLVNKITGEKRVFEHIDDNPVLEIGDVDYFYFWDKNGGFLIDNKDFKKEIKLPKIYKSVTYRGKYLVGIIDNSTVDVFRKDDFGVISMNLKATDFDYFEKIGNYQDALVLWNASKITVLDSQLKKVATFDAKVKDFTELKAFLEKKFKTVTTEKYPMTTGMAVAPEYPLIDSKKDTDGKEVFFFKEKGGVQIPFIKVNRKNLGVSIDSYHHELSFHTKSGARIFTQFEFHIDPATHAIFLPKKYWVELELEKIDQK